MRGWAASTLLVLAVLDAPVTKAQDGGGRFYGDRVLRCESKGAKPSLCPADVRGGVRLLRTLSKANCIEGQSWGVNQSGVWVQSGCRADFVLGYGGTLGNAAGSRVVRCESRGNRWQHCDADTSAGAELVRQLSRNPCIRGQNWGADARGVWVSGGCRAEFRMMVAVSEGRPPGRIVRCESIGKQHQRCEFDTSGGVRLYRQQSRSACIEGRSWGFDPSGIWVQDGCRAEFELRTTSPSGG